jgi:hypothetical protein
VAEGVGPEFKPQYPPQKKVQRNNKAWNYGFSQEPWGGGDDRSLQVMPALRGVQIEPREVIDLRKA